MFVCLSKFSPYNRLWSVCNVPYLLSNDIWALAEENGYRTDENPRLYLNVKIPQTEKMSMYC